MKRLALLALIASCASPTTPTGAVEAGEGRPAPVETSPAPTVTPVPTSRVPRTVPHASRSRRETVDPTAETGSHLNWHALRECESSNNYNDRDSATYRGAYQFDRQTWRSVGGTGDPADASPAEQDSRALRLYEKRGRSPWPVCGRHL